MKVRDPSSWQQVLFGEAQHLRPVVFEELLKSRGEKRAKRYALCGYADEVFTGPRGASIRPRGCGDKLCPRCSRRRGTRHARRILGWLGHVEHGDLWVACLTQPVIVGELVQDARKRMEVKARRFLRHWDRRGLVSALATAHVVWSASADGWHYHVHFLLELPCGSVDAAGMREAALVAAAGDEWCDSPGWCRLVLAAGGALAGLRDDAGDTDMWHESVDAASRAVQYPLRDLLQGVSAWRLGGCDEKVEACVKELVSATHGWKMFRSWGRWRGMCPEAVAAAAEEAEVAPADSASARVSSPGPRGEGTVMAVFYRAKAGDEFARSLLKALEASCRNTSGFGKRLVKFVRMGVG